MHNRRCCATLHLCTCSRVRCRGVCTGSAAHLVRAEVRVCILLLRAVGEQREGFAGRNGHGAPAHRTPHSFSCHCLAVCGSGTSRLECGLLVNSMKVLLDATVHDVPGPTRPT